MENIFKKVNEIRSGKYNKKNRIDGQFVGNRNDLIIFIKKKFNQPSIVIYEAYEELAEKQLKNKADQAEGRYCYFQEVSSEVIKLLKNTTYIQGLYVFVDNECVLYTEDNLEDITLIVDALI